MTERQHNGLILVVDDNPTHLGLLTDALTGSGFEIAVARDGEMALEQIGYEPPDLILLDVVMPGIDGFETCRRLKADPATRDIPVIFMTAHADTADRVQGLELGAVDFITKPFQQEEVLARVRSQLRLQRLTRMLAEQNALLQRKIEDHAAAERALQELTNELELRVEARTAELSRALRELEQARTETQEISEALRRSNEALEGEVARRIEELCQTAERLERELGERARAEEGRAALQQEVIRVHEARLAELSTPLIPITERIVVMPLIGTMDAARADQLLGVALEGVHREGATVVILDITGVRAVDAGVAGALVRTAGALRLLGAEAVITGMRPEVAQALVELDLELGEVVTRGNLRGGIAYALGRTGADPRLLERGRGR